MNTVKITVKTVALIDKMVGLMLDELNTPEDWHSKDYILDNISALRKAAKAIENKEGVNND